MEDIQLVTLSIGGAAAKELVDTEVEAATTKVKMKRRIYIQIFVKSK
ncbi:MAG: hypothetical protein PUP91_03035 [Rhizonema sp. PD37]|nr:hypothetical protein [Rhizonema sp. PD37]